MGEVRDREKRWAIGVALGVLPRDAVVKEAFDATVDKLLKEEGIL